MKKNQVFFFPFLFCLIRVYVNRINVANLDYGLKGLQRCSRGTPLLPFKMLRDSQRDVNQHLVSVLGLII